LLRTMSRASLPPTTNSASSCPLYFFRLSRCAFRTSGWSSTKSMRLIASPVNQSHTKPAVLLGIDFSRGNLYTLKEFNAFGRTDWLRLWPFLQMRALFPHLPAHERVS